VEPTCTEELPDLLPGLRRLVARYAAAGDVDDVTQECCVRIVEKAGLWERARGPFRAWARTVARRVTLNRLRRPRAERLGEEPAQRAPEYPPDQVRWVLEQLARLPEPLRSTLHLHYYEGLPLAAVGERLGISQPAASKRVARALETLRGRARQQGLLSTFLPAGWAAALASSPKMKILVLGTLAALFGTAAGSFFLPSSDTHLVARTDALPRTSFADSLDSPLDPNGNLIWCASLPLAWNELRELLGGDVHLLDQPPIVDRLNATRVRRSDVDEDSLVARAGYVKDGIVEEIQAELERVFGEGRDPVFDRRGGNETLQILAYAFLFQSLRFPVPFEDLEEERLAFTHREEKGDRQTAVDSFGIARLKHAAETEHHRALAKQVSVYDHRSNDDVIVRLHAKGSKDRILLARVEPGKSLGETWDRVWKRVRESKPERMHPGDSLRVPEIDFHLTHRFDELAGRTFANPGFEDSFIVDAVQDLRLKLDEHGVVMKSRSVIRVAADVSPEPVRLHFDQPFLLALLREGAETPYLVTWIAHPEILVGLEPEEDGDDRED